MASYLVAFELNGPGRDATALVPVLASLGKAVECLEGAWLVTSEHSAEEIRDALRQDLHPSDRLMVCALAGALAWHGVPKVAAEELRAALRSFRS